MENKIPKEWFKTKERYGKKYDESMAKFLVVELLKNYKRVILINNDDIDDTQGLCRRYGCLYE